MSLDAGGLAQMTYNTNFPPNRGLGVPGAGFASRGKGAGLKRLSVAAPPKIASIAENHVDAQPTPRTSKAHYLAGLRTAPKTASAVPASAPYHQAQHRFDDGMKHMGAGQTRYGAPQTATGANFPMSAPNQFVMGTGQQMYALPEQVLAPPSMQFNGADEDGMDPNLMAQLLLTEAYLQQRQQQLQQQLLQLTAGQLQGLNLGNNGGYRQPQQFPMTPMTPNMNLYNQQLQNGGSTPQEVPGQPGAYMVYNPLTGQYNYVVDHSVHQQNQLANSPPPPTPSYTSSPPKVATPTFRAEVSPPAEETSPPQFALRNSPPPKKSPSPPQDVTPLPPPSANAFRRGHHKKVSSLAFNLNGDSIPDGPKSAFVRSSGFPQTPMTGTFGPGQGRAGEHPIRQPRGPPPLEELQAAPTTKHEGSKNFATRTRRRALHSLVRAGIERRGVRSGSGGSMTPVSETDVAFSLHSSDNDSDSVHSHGSGSLSGKPSIGSLRAAANGAIGSERKEMKERSRERGSVEKAYTNSVSSDEGVGIGTKLVEVYAEEKATNGERRKTPMLVLTSAEKRKSTMF